MQQKALSLYVWHLSKPVLNRHLRSAGEENSQPHSVCRPRHCQELHDELRVIAAFIFVKSVDHQHKNCWALHLRPRLGDEMLPLMAQRLAGNLRTLWEGITDMTLNAGHAQCRLDRNAGDDLAARPTSPPSASREGKASTQTLLCMIPAGD
ncbi:hypothetical protein HBH69_226050 [Parastagonospora nodorum]|nr:hypothetical protein HBH69_226050 [Parastagonospora nodorum]